MKEENALLNDALNTFYLQLYGVGHMVKYHSDRLLLPINSKGSFICTIPDRIAHTTAFVTPVVEHWLEREIAQWVHPMKDRSDDPSHYERTLLPPSYISLPATIRFTQNVSCNFYTHTKYQQVTNVTSVIIHQAVNANEQIGYMTYYLHK